MIHEQLLLQIAEVVDGKEDDKVKLLLIKQLAELSAKIKTNVGNTFTPHNTMLHAPAPVQPAPQPTTQSEQSDKDLMKKMQDSWQAKLPKGKNGRPRQTS